MAVVGAQATVIQETGLFADVNAFSNEVSQLKRIPINDVVIAYDCPFRLQTYLLIIKNALHVPSMEHNLIPPFIMEEAGLEVDAKAKIHSKNLNVSNHSIFDPETTLRIPLNLRGIFSCFKSRSLTDDEIMNCKEYSTIYLTPESSQWDPHSVHWAEAEEALLDADGEIPYPLAKQPTHLINEDDAEVCSIEVFEKRIDDVIVSSIEGNPQEGMADSRDEWLIVEDAIRAHISATDPMLDSDLMGADIRERTLRSKMMTAAGSTTVNADGCELFEAALESEPGMASVGATSASKPRGVTAETLSKIWRIDYETAARTLKVTTQLNHQGGNETLSRHFGTNDRMLRYKRIQSEFYTDTFFVTGKARSIRGYTCMQIFVSDKGFVKVYPMRHQREYPLALKLFAKDVGAPEILVADPHPSQKSHDVKAFCNQIGTTLKLLEESTQWANRAELYVGLLKESTRKDLAARHSPLVLWDYCAERRAMIFCLTARNLFQLQGTTPYTATFGEEGDISNLCRFDWYDWVYFWDGSAKYPFPKLSLGRCLGPVKNEGNEMCQAILKQNGKVVPRRSCRPLNAGELAASNEVEVRKRAEFDAAIKQKLGDSFSLPTHVQPQQAGDSKDASNPQDETFDPFTGVEEPHIEVPEADCVDATGKPILQQSLADTLIHSEVLLPHGEDLQMAKVLRRSVNPEGRVIGNANDNPLLNTLMYDVEFPDGNIKKYAANIIAENVLVNCDSEGFYSSQMSCIVDHKCDGSAVPMEQKYIKSKNGQMKLRPTTVGWSFNIKWKDGTSDWVPLKILKESNPVDIAEYAVARGIDDEPAFAWWIPYTLRKRDVIVSAINTRVRRKTHKYGIEVPSSLKDAIRLDTLAGDSKWSDAHKMEMMNVGVAFEILPNGEKAPPGWSKASGHLIFDVKMDFTRKARWVKDGHRTPDPKTSTYAGVVSRESIRIALTYAALHQIDVKCADIKNAYLQAPSSEKHFINCGPEFGLENVGKVALIRRALYGGKAAGRDFWHHLRSCMEHLKFESSKADPDVWFRASKRKDGTPYYEYVLLYTDDCLVISDNAEAILRNEIGKSFTLKEKSIGNPGQYLGGKLRKVTLDNGVDCWGFSSTQYVQDAVNNVEQYLKSKGKKLVPKAPAPMTNGYRPEIDISEELPEDEASYYHSLIGVLRWIVELGRVDINTEVSMMSSHLALPRRGHLDEVFHIFAYLKKKHNSEMVYDPTEVEIDRAAFPREDWSYSIYGDDNLEEVLPLNMPIPLGKSFTCRVYVDSDHAGDQVTRRSRTGFIVFLNSAPIYWSSKKQTSCETSTYGSELLAMKQATEFVRGLRYKLRMMGIPVDEPAFVFGDNQSVLANTTNPGSTIKKKCHSIAYHFVREGCSRDEWRTAYIKTAENIADLLTKPLPSGEKRWYFVSKILHWLGSTG